MRKMVTTAVAVALLVAGTAPVAPAQELSDDPSSRGTTGLFVIPRAGTLQPGGFSLGVFYSTVAREEGDSNVETYGIVGGFAFGAAERLEIFGSFEPRVQVERDFLPTLAEKQPIEFAARLNDHPFAADFFQKGVGDLRLGLKFKLAGPADGYNGAAVAGIVKLPTADDDAGIGTGKFDATGMVIGSYEAGEAVGLNGFVGATYKGDPDEIDVANEFLWGGGIEAPTRFWLRALLEVYGVRGSLDATPIPESKAGSDLAVVQAGFRATSSYGLAITAGLNYNLSFDVEGTFPDLPAGEELPVNRGGGFAMVSYSRSPREPVLFQGTSPRDLPPVNRPPTLTCRAERDSVRVGESVRLFADANDPDGDPVTVTWSAPAGRLEPTTGTEVTWSTEGVRPGSGTIRARVSDGYGGEATCEVRVTVAEPPPPPEPTELNFMCAEFTSGSSRIDNRCKAVLDDVALQLRQNPRATAVITGHSDSQGSQDVIARLAQERADNARTYLVETHGIDASRIETRNEGASRPIADNSTTAGRAQNRRIEIVVTIPPGE